MEKQTPKTLNAKEAAAFIGVSPATFWRKRKKGEIQLSGIPNRFSVAQLQKLIENTADTKEA